MKQSNLHIYVPGEQIQAHRALDLLTVAASVLGFLTAVTFLVNL